MADFWRLAKCLSDVWVRGRIPVSVSPVCKDCEIPGHIRRFGWCVRRQKAYVTSLENGGELGLPLRVECIACWYWFDPRRPILCPFSWQSSSAPFAAKIYLFSHHIFTFDFDQISLLLGIFLFFNWIYFLIYAGCPKLVTLCFRDIFECLLLKISVLSRALAHFSRSARLGRTLTKMTTESLFGLCRANFIDRKFSFYI